MSSFDRSDTYNKVVEIVVEKLNVDKQTVENATTFESLGADSLDMVEIIMQLEEEFSIKIDDSVAEKLTSVDEVVEYIHTERQK